jgi:hypothetical protein
MTVTMNADRRRTQLSLMHPRLFYGLALVEPIIQNAPPPGQNAAMSTSFRRDIWPSRAEAEASLVKNPFFRALNRQVLEKYLQFGLREVPTAIYPISEKQNIRPGAVTLTTTKHQEAWSYVRPNFNPLPSDSGDHKERLISPDQDPLNEGTHMFVCAGAKLAFLALPYLPPAILWIYGNTSHVNIRQEREKKMARTGIGRGGSGGKEAGKVKEIILDQTGHLVPFEKVSECAKAIQDWMQGELNRYWLAEDSYKTYQSRKFQNGLVLSNEWMEGVKLQSDVKRQSRVKL